MRALDTKLVRDFRRLWAQSLAVALVLACGVATLILAIGAYQSLYETRETYYERYRFASVFSTARRAPERLRSGLEAIPGVAIAETRIVLPVVLDIEDMAEPASGLVQSIPDHGPPLLNRLYLRAGRMPEPGRRGEALVLESFATAHGFTVGSRFFGTVSGRRVGFVVTGIALSPETIYTVGPGDLVPDDRRYSVIWMRRGELAGMADLEGAFNAVSATLLPGARESAVISAVDRLLAPFGSTGAYGRKDQVSHAFIDSELSQLKAMAQVIPPIFLFVSAFLINMILSRLITLEREQIGLLKAVGYSRFAVAMHYMKLVVAIALAGTLIGFVAGTWLGTGLTRLYGDFFRFPFLIFERDPRLYVLAGGVSVAAAVAGALKAVLEAAALPPAVAMQPAPPTRYRRAGILSSLSTGVVSELARMAFRHLFRWPLRSGLTMLGTALSVALLVSAMFSTGAVNHMVNVVFFQSARQDASIAFHEARGPGAVEAAKRLPGVLAVEPYRTAVVELTHGSRSLRMALIGKPREASLNRLLDTRLQPVDLPPVGLVLSRYVADKLAVPPGGSVDMRLFEEGRTVSQVPVTQIVQSYIGVDSYMDIDAMNRLSREGPRVSGVYLRIDPARLGEIYAAIKDMPQASSIALKDISLQKFRDTINENIHIMTVVYVVLAIIIAFGVVYNSARIQLSERARELASLRVLGFTRREVASVLVTELFVLAALAQPVGWGLGIGLSWAIVQGFRNDMFRVPFVIEPAALGWASIVVMSAVAISALVVVQRVRRLDLVRVLKTRE